MMFKVLDNLTETYSDREFYTVEDAMDSEEFAEAAQPTVVEYDDRTPEQKKTHEAVQQWRIIRNGAWLMAAAAIRERSWQHVKQAESIIWDAGNHSDPLLAAIFGCKAPDLSNRLYQALYTAGQGATDDMIKQAVAMVKQNDENRKKAYQRNKNR